MPSSIPQILIFRTPRKMLLNLTSMPYMRQVSLLVVVVGCTSYVVREQIANFLVRACMGME